MNDNFVKNRKVAKKLGKSFSLKKGTGGINPCWKPSNEASKDGLKEYHQEEMKLRKARR